MEVGEREFALVARAMIELFGDQAAIKARERAQEYMQAGETDGEEFWTKLAGRITCLLNAKS
jgi:hypothetical protein